MVQQPRALPALIDDPSSSGSQPPMTPVPGSATRPSGLQGTCTHVHTHNIHIIFKIKEDKIVTILNKSQKPELF